MKQRLIELENRVRVKSNDYKPTNGLQDRIIEVERRCSQQEQYSRRETVEIVGLPNNINNEELEDTVVEVFKTAGMTFMLYIG